MELKEYIFRYFKFNRNSDKKFVSSFFRIFNYKIKKEDYYLIKPFLNKICKFYEYSFDKDEIRDFKELILDEDKCIISTDYKTGFFYDSNRDEFNFFGNLFFIINRKYKKIEMEFIHNDKEWAYKYYYPRIKNPSEGFTSFFSALYGSHMSLHVYDALPDFLKECTEEELDVITDLFIDLYDCDDFLFKCLGLELKNKKVLDYLYLMDECENLPDNARCDVWLKLYKLTNKIKDINKLKRLMHKRNFFMDYPFVYLNPNDTKIYKKLLKETFFSRGVCSFSFSDYLKYCVNNKLSKDYDYLLYRFIFTDYNKNYYNVIKDVVDELFKLDTFDDEKAEYLLKKYSNYLDLEGILNRCGEADSFTLESSFGEIEYNEAGLKYYRKHFDTYLKYFKNLTQLKAEYPEFDKLYKKYYKTLKPYYIFTTSDQYKRGESYLDQDKYFSEEESKNINKDILEYTKWRLCRRYYQRRGLDLYYRDVKTGIDVLDRNMISMERRQRYRDYKWPKIRVYKFKLNEETKKWLIEKKLISNYDDLVDLHIYRGDKLIYINHNCADQFEFFD